LLSAQQNRTAPVKPGERAVKLEVMSISFLRSGALSVEVAAQTQKDTSTEAFLDVVKMWVYLPTFDKSDRMEDILNAALKVAAESLK
jgi:hypothetical protein